MATTTKLAHFLANVFYRKDDFEAIVIDTGYSPGMLHITNSALNNWIFFVREVQTDGRVKYLVEAALKRKPQNDYLQTLSLDPDTDFKSPYDSPTPMVVENIDKIKNNEAITASFNTIFPISFLQKGMLKARCVVMIRTSGSLGTGFVLRDNYLMTNNHVIANKEIAGTAIITFHYQRDHTNQFMKVERTSLAPDLGFFTDVQRDWTLVKLKRNPLAEDDFLELAAFDAQVDDFVNIIQHPGGDEKKIALYHNTVTSVKDGNIQYLTDTQGGSSGSPVFNSDWEVVALHHSNSTYSDSAGPDKLCNQGTSAQILKNQISALLPSLQLTSSYAATE